VVGVLADLAGKSKAEQPALAVRRLVAVLVAAFAAPNTSVNPAPMRSEEVT